MKKRNIDFTVLEDGVAQEIKTYEGEYRNLMFLLADQLYLDGFGECGGLGRCATCVVSINNLSNSFTKNERNEPSTLTKAGYYHQNIRLSCQIFIIEELRDSVIEIIQ